MLNYDGSLVKTEYFAGSLLFAMGMQNALVSMISGSVVRTTHLTGMFTDLGIDLSAMVFEPGMRDRTHRRKVILRVSIITFFLVGGMLGGWLFIRYSFHVFIVPVALLVVALLYDYFRIRVTRHLRRIQAKQQVTGTGRPPAGAP